MYGVYPQEMFSCKQFLIAAICLHSYNACMHEWMCSCAF